MFEAFHQQRLETRRVGAGRVEQVVDLVTARYRQYCGENRTIYVLYATTLYLVELAGLNVNEQNRSFFAPGFADVDFLKASTSARGDPNINKSLTSKSNLL